MSSTPESLPEILPVFPLTGILLLPGTILPLHVFEPRYRNMVEDALKAGAIFGMIQPIVPQHDNRPMPGADQESPELYRIGCAGQIEQWERMPDGRYMIQLRGLRRFRSREELPLQRGYRQVIADYKEFVAADAERDWHGDRSRLIEALKAYGARYGFKVEMENLDRFTELELLNLVAVSLPFHPAEKQALLEARSLKDREAVLLDLLRLGSGPAGSAGSDLPPRTIN